MGSPDEIIPRDKIENIFENIEAIHKVNTDFFKNLKERIASWDEVGSTLGDLFLESVFSAFP